MRERKWVQEILLYSIVFLLTLPIFILLIWSFTKTWPWPDLIPKDVGLRGWRYIIDPHTKILKILCFSFFLSLAVTFVTLLVSLPAAKAIGQHNFKGKKAIQIFILSPIIVPPLAVAMGIHVKFIQMGLADTFWGILLVHLIPCIPYAVRILTNVYEALGTRMEQQARILGANRLQTQFHVMLPLLAPGLVSAGSLVFIISFSQYFLTYLVGGGKIITLSMVLFPFIESGDRAIASALSLIFIAITLIFFLLINKILRTHLNTQDYFYL
ncbi:putative spermidine/putrescine transport system permease protein [Geosporobacter subterraneus DSM 17957]|uniref:Putative spermidine/putrescine transport system permease protein n=1 Tax=Geosporobacter subterraneus DSM 17957 TaxID=1121919 RepID=A0A1M6BXF8_9FIRM|nr:ABC transporter permease subunit [Geosporobacter subterraneus]SHI53303.1 putative spermidine/putrescine transport system permease protein [Geosporobacter subterraneus DSM 17957]